LEDIRLTRGVNGYDWQFQSDNITPCNNLMGIINSIIHDLHLKKGELRQQIYRDKGVAFIAQNQVKTENNIKLIEEQMLLIIKSVNHVIDAQILNTNIENGYINNKINVQTDYGDVIIETTL